MVEDKVLSALVGEHLYVTDISGKRETADWKVDKRTRSIQLQKQPVIEDRIANENAVWHIGSISILQENSIPQEAAENAEPHVQRAVKLTFNNAHQSPERLEYVCRLCRNLFSDHDGNSEVEVGSSSGSGVNETNVTISPKAGSEVDVFSKMNDLLVELEAANLISRKAATEAAPFLGVKKQSFMDLNWRAVFKDEKAGGHFNYLERSLGELRAKQAKCTFSVDYGITEKISAADPGFASKAEAGGRGTLDTASITARRAHFSNFPEV